jgi:hypothetical protein
MAVSDYFGCSSSTASARLSAESSGVFGFSFVVSVLFAGADLDTLAFARRASTPIMS